MEDASTPEEENHYMQFAKMHPGKRTMVQMLLAVPYPCDMNCKASMVSYLPVVHDIYAFNELSVSAGDSGVLGDASHAHASGDELVRDARAVWRRDAGAGACS